MVFAIDDSGPVIEGVGVIASYGAAQNQYRIRFIGEGILQTRFVHPDWQADPERALALLTEFWRFCRRGDPRIEDFFPDKID